jgi:hypothetical protein
MRVLLVPLIFLMFTSFKSPGSGTAYLTCKSESGRTIFKAELQDFDRLEKAELIVDNKKVSFNDSDEAYTIFDAETGVFTVYITGDANKEFPNGRFIQFWAIPKSFKILNSTISNQKYEFKARIEGSEPRKGQDKDLRIPQVELNCVLEYSI